MMTKARVLSYTTLTDVRCSYVNAGCRLLGLRDSGIRQPMATSRCRSWVDCCRTPGVLVAGIWPLVLVFILSLTAAVLGFRQAELHNLQPEQG